jgi:signal peptidase I
MDINFPLILVLATFATGFIWLLDHFLWQPKRELATTEIQQAVEVQGNDVGDPKQGFSVNSLSEVSSVNKAALTGEQDVPWLVDISRSFFPVLLIVLILRSFLVEPFQIPSGSMLPTLEVGDFILVNKFAYGVRLPVLGTKIIKVGEPQRGDVFVFHHPGDGVNYIKRVIGLPGDHIKYENKTLYINGIKVKTQFVANIELGSQPMSQLYVEQLGKVKHDIYIMPSQTNGKEGEWTVPKGEYFAMGDNRDNSNDSRYWGFVPEKNIVGKAFAIWMNWKSFTTLPSFSRVGSIH